MGIHSGKLGDARARAAPPGAADRRPPRPPAPRLGAAAAGLILLLAALIAAAPVAAAQLRVAAWGADLSRDGPGLLLRDIIGGEDPAVEGTAAILAEARPDLLLLTDIDWDADGVALAALAERLGREGLRYPHRLALAPNAGLPSGLDLDGNGRLGEPRDAQGCGRFRGQGGMAILSRWPLGEVRDLSALLWRDLPGARLPTRHGAPFPSEEAQVAQRLSSSGHWIVPVEAPGGPLTLLAWAATPPVFDGPEDMNGLRNADELALWARVLDGALGPVPQDAILLGDANLDPIDGQGLSGDMAVFLADPRLQDPAPGSDGARAAASPGHGGDAALDTSDWAEDGAGNLRTHYVLPAAAFRVLGAGVVWPLPGEPLSEAADAAGPHRLVWVDIDR